MIFISRPHLKRIVDAAEAAYPGECCGLLAGRRHANGDLEVTRVAPSPNLANTGADPGADIGADSGADTRADTKVPGAGRRDRFEVDPALRLRLQRDLKGGDAQIIGLYHSHPDHSAQPSTHDLDSVWEPEFVWLITAVEAGQAVHTTAHVLDAGGRQFRPIELRSTDWEPYPVRAPRPGEEA